MEAPNYLEDKKINQDLYKSFNNLISKEILFEYIDEHKVKDADEIKASLQNAGEGFIKIDRKQKTDYYAYYKILYN